MRIILTRNTEPPYNLMRIAPNQKLIPEYPDEDALLDYVVARNKEVGVIGPEAPYWIIDSADQPDEYFFDAWEWRNRSPAINMHKAREVHMAAIRRVRNTELAALDVPYLRAIEAGDAGVASDIARTKQVLRDIPQTIDLSTENPDRLKALWPSELPQREP